MAALKALRHPKTPDRPKHTALPKTSHRAEHGTTPYAATRRMRRRPQTVRPLKTPHDARCCAGQDAAAKQEAVSQTTCGAPHETPQPNKGRARDKMRRLSRGFFANRDRWFSFDDSRLGKKKKSQKLDEGVSRASDWRCRRELLESASPVAFADIRTLRRACGIPISRPGLPYPPKFGATLSFAAC